jgi:hypothetical protein
MRRAGLLVNPRAGKQSGKGVQLAEKLRSQRDISVHLLHEFEELRRALIGFAAEGVTDLFISSGDGTVQAIQTLLVEDKIFTPLPRLCLLPHGTTNMTAADVGFRHRNLEAQLRMMQELAPGDMRQRHTLRAANPLDGRPRHGMFLGTGAVSEATRFCQRVFNARGVKGNAAVFATLAGAVLRTMFTAPNPADEARFDRPFEISLGHKGEELLRGPQLLMLATTLDKLILGTRPFWGGKQEPIRVSTFPYPVPSIVRWLLPIMYGSETRRVPPGALSLSARAIDVRSPVSYVIDGEFFDGPADKPLHLETGPVFTYLCSR